MGKNKQFYWITILLLLLIVAITFFASRKYFNPEKFNTNTSDTSNLSPASISKNANVNVNANESVVIPPDDDIHISISDYSIQEIDNFLNDDECDKLIQIASTRLEPSRVYTDSADLNDTQNRKSDQA